MSALSLQFPKKPNDVVDDLESRVDDALGAGQRDGFREALGRALDAVEPVARG